MNPDVAPLLLLLRVSFRGCAAARRDWDGFESGLLATLWLQKQPDVFVLVVDSTSPTHTLLCQSRPLNLFLFFFSSSRSLILKKKGRTTRGGREVKREKIKKQLKHHSQEKKQRKMGHKRLISLFDTCDDRESLLRPFLSILLIFPSTKLNSHHPNRNWIISKGTTRCRECRRPTTEMSSLFGQIHFS